MNKAQVAIKREASERALQRGLPPVIGPLTRLLVLGSFPSESSLAAQQYYAHPRNQFWLLLAALWPQHAQPSAQDYDGRCAWLLARGLGLWDLYVACERSGSLDSAIRCVQMNDFAALAAQCPRVSGVAHNGGESARHASAVRSGWAGADHAAAPVSHRLPSTSPAFAAMRFDTKCDAWAAVMGAHSLL